jgi:hypothetical protein
MKTYILAKSPIKGKKFRISMGDHHHDFGSDVGKTFIDHKDVKIKKDWIARHKNDKNFNNKHSGIYHSRKLLWSEPTLKQAIAKYEKEHGVKLVYTNA